MGELKCKASHYAEAFGGASQLSDVAGRKRKAEKIKAVLREENVLQRQGVRILDIGCSFGIILHELTPDDGLCYFAGANKYDLIEPHYRLPFLSCLPGRIAAADMVPPNSLKRHVALAIWKFVPALFPDSFMFSGSMPRVFSETAPCRSVCLQ